MWRLDVVWFLLLVICLKIHGGLHYFLFHIWLKQLVETRLEIINENYMNGFTLAMVDLIADIQICSKTYFWELVFHTHQSAGGNMHTYTHTNINYCYVSMELTNAVASPNESNTISANSQPPYFTVTCMDTQTVQAVIQL